MNRTIMSPVDALLIEFDKALRTVFAPAQAQRINPADAVVDVPLLSEQKAHAAALMRVNHCGEVCAQALYQGQSLTSKNEVTRNKLDEAAREEIDHLAWSETRIRELGGRISLLNPLWYAGSLAMGMVAGLAGDKWSLGFLVETERQVGAHLERHLQQLAPEDVKTRILVEAMRDDELGHAETAKELGGAELPVPLKALMKLTAGVMTRTSYWI